MMYIKTIYYNSKLAKLILFGDYTTIMFFGFILTKLKELSETIIRHEGHIRNSSSSVWR